MLSGKVWVSIKFLSAKFGFTPPPSPKRTQNEEKMYKSVKNLKIDTFSGGGGGTRIYGQNDFMDIWAFLMHFLASPSVTFVLSCFGACPLHERKGIPLPTRGFEGLFRKTTLVLTLYCCEWGHCTSVIFVWVRCEGRFRGDPSVHIKAP